MQAEQKLKADVIQCPRHRYLTAVFKYSGLVQVLELFQNYSV